MMSMKIISRVCKCKLGHFGLVKCSTWCGKLTDYFSENGIQTPRSLALSEMGSEVDVDQSLNISSFAIATNNEISCNGIPATDFQEITDVTDLSRAIVSESIDHARVEVSVNHMTLNDLNDRSDSGTDSFSEQMVSGWSMMFWPSDGDKELLI